MRRWADRNRAVALTQFPPFHVAPFMLTHFCFVNPQVHWPCLVHWVTAGPKHNSASRTAFPESLYVAHIPVTPGKMTQTYDWLLGFALVVDVSRIAILASCEYWRMIKSLFLATGFGTSIHTVPNSFHWPTLKIYACGDSLYVFEIASNVWWRSWLKRTDGFQRCDLACSQTSRSPFTSDQSFLSITHRFSAAWSQTQWSFSPSPRALCQGKRCVFFVARL